METHECAKQSTDKGDETIEDGDGACDDVRNKTDSCGAADPGAPVYYAVGGEVPGASEGADEDEFRGKLVVLC